MEAVSTRIALHGNSLAIAPFESGIPPHLVPPSPVTFGLSEPGYRVEFSDDLTLWKPIAVPVEIGWKEAGRR
jgi:hypothetical protein